VVERSLSLHEKVERWGAEARKLAESGREVAALDLYRKAADAMPGAPWLQLRTGELSRKLRQNDQAVNYFVRAADAFLAAGFEKRAVPALRSAWSVARQGAPRSLDSFIQVTYKLARLQFELGLATDATVTVEYANDTLRRLGLSELDESDVLANARVAADRAS
jgi:tetratricopeptide (TPR) repeat protein